MGRLRRGAGARDRGGEEGRAGRPPLIVLFLALLAPLLNVVPTIEGGLRAHPPDQVYLGLRWMTGDHVQYGSFSRQGEAGRLLMENMFTTEPQRPSYVLLYFNVVGIVMRLTGLGFPLTWEILRVVFGFALLLAAWYFTGLFYPDRSRRLLAWILVAFSGGLYYLASLLPEEMLRRPGYPYLTDPAHHHWNWSTFSSMLVGLWIPPVVLLLLAAILLLTERRIAAAARAAGLFAAGPLIWFFHPHSGNAAYLAFGLFALAPALGALWRLEPVPWGKTVEAFQRSAPFLLSFAVIAAYLSWASGDAVFAATGRAAAKWNPTYTVFWYPLVYGLLLLFGALGIRWAGTLPQRPRHLLLSWLASAFILSVNPLFSGVKYQFLVHLPLAVLAAHGISELRKRSAWAARASRGAVGVVVAGGLLLHGPVSILRDMTAPLADEPYAFVARSEAAASRFLDTQPPGAVLCGYRACGTIAYLGGKKVFTGHWLLTLDQREKQLELAGFFREGMPVEARREFLARHGIRYVYFGPAERAMGRIDPGLGLEKIYGEGDVAIYRVR